MHLKKVLRNSAAQLALAALFTLSASAITLTGTVTNKTTGKPASGDSVAAVNLMNGMNDVANVNTDARGHYKMSVADGGQYLLRVSHSGADYFARVTPGTTSTDIDVFDAAMHVDGLSGEAIVVRAETDPVGKSLNMGMNFFISNASTPARTQFGGNTYDFYLPKGAIIVESLANSTGGMPVQSAVTTLDKDSGHYAFTFPIRPGETRFQVSYTLPYNGKQSISVKPSLPTSDVAIMLPKSMTFQGNGPTTFQPINEDTTLQTFDAHNPQITQPIDFTITGSGQLPQVRDAGDTGSDASGGQQADASGAPGASSNRPGGGMANPIDTPDPLSKYKWWIIGSLALALIAGAGYLLAPKNPNANAVAEVHPLTPQGPSHVSPSPYQNSASLNALKEELFHLETDRHNGKITEEQYAAHKGAIDTLMRRVLAREGHLGTDVRSPFQSPSQSDPKLPGDTADPYKDTYKP